MSFAVCNHYVPQWYQRRFLPRGVSKLEYLDLHPDVIRRPDGTTTTRKALRQLGPINCFAQDHLYTRFFGDKANDSIEKHFFGQLETAGAQAVPFFAAYGMKDGAHEAFRAMLDYLSAQLLRTPKGLQLLRAVTGSDHHQRVLVALQHLLQVFQTIWGEGVWEVVTCEQSPTKFIIGDSPVITFNHQVYPGAEEVRSLGMARIERLGTRTLFPLDSNHCLVITNLQFVRNPKTRPLRFRENPRYFAPAMFDLRKVQRGREIEEGEVISINHVLKSHAVRYVAATNMDWLYPERAVGKTPWPKLGGPYFLMPDPRKVSFCTSTMVGFNDGTAWAINEYGHRQVDNPRATQLRAVEWSTFQASKRAWDERDRRAGRPIPEIDRDYF